MDYVAPINFDNRPLILPMSHVMRHIDRLLTLCSRPQELHLYVLWPTATSAKKMSRSLRNCSTQSHPKKKHATCNWWQPIPMYLAYINRLNIMHLITINKIEKSTNYNPYQVSYKQGPCPRQWTLPSKITRDWNIVSISTANSFCMWLCWLRLWLTTIQVFK